MLDGQAMTVWAVRGAACADVCAPRWYACGAREHRIWRSTTTSDDVH